MNQPPLGPGQPNPFEPPPAGSYGLPVPSYGSAPPASTEAIGAIVCGVLAWSCFPLSIGALWLGARARRAARENPERVGGAQLALAGMMLGGFFGVVWLLCLLAYAAVLLFAIGFGVFHK